MNRKIPSREFESMSFDIFNKVKNRSVFTTFPELKEFFQDLLQTKQPLNENKLVKYIIYCYDKNSPLHLYYNNILKKKQEAAILAGWKPDAFNDFSTDMQDLFANSNPVAIQMINRWVKAQNDLDYTHLVYLMEMYNNQMLSATRYDKEASDVTTAKKWSVVHKDATNLLNEIKTLSEQLFKGDEEQVDYISYIQEAERHQIKILPEHYAIGFTEIPRIQGYKPR